MVRYADDIVIGFDKRYDARRFRIAMQRRLRELDWRFTGENPSDGSSAASLPKTVPSGKGKPETFNFLGFTHISGKIATAGSCWYERPAGIGWRQLKAIKDGLRRRWHYRSRTGKMAQESGSGIPNYHSVPATSHHAEVQDTRNKPRRRALRRRSQKDDTTWRKQQTGSRMATKGSVLSMACGSGHRQTPEAGARACMPGSVGGIR